VLTKGLVLTDVFWCRVWRDARGGINTSQDWNGEEKQRKKILPYTYKKKMEIREIVATSYLVLSSFEFKESVHVQLQLP